MPDARTWGITTITVCGITWVYAIAGAVLVITDHAFSFQEYGTLLVGFLAANGILGIGRGLRLRDHPIAERTKGSRKTSRGEAS